MKGRPSNCPAGPAERERRAELMAHVGEEAQLCSQHFLHLVRKLALLFHGVAEGGGYATRLGKIGIHGTCARHHKQYGDDNEYEQILTLRS